MNHGSMFAAQSGSRLLSLYRFSSSIFSCKKETGMEHPRVLCGSVLTWNARKAMLSFQIFERWNIGYVCVRKKRSMSERTRFTFRSGDARTRQLR